MTTTTLLSASDFNSTSLAVGATSSAGLYQRTAYNILNASTSTAVNIGNLISNQTQLTTYGEVTGSNNTDYYSFNLTGSSIKGSFSNITNTTNLRFQVLNSSGTIIADNQGTTAQQTAYASLTSASGLEATSGQYFVKVSYAPVAQQSLPQSYGFQLYSGGQFQASYETTAQTQNISTTVVPTDNTMTYATAGAGLYTASQYNKIGAKASTAINIGWLAANSTSLSLTSQLTAADNTDYYSFTFQKGSSLKLAFNNSTNTSTLRFQLYDNSGTQLIADSQGTTAQRAAYAALTSSSGLTQNPGSYIVKVSFAQGASQSKTQTYNFQVSSGSYYSSLDKTTASAQTIGNAIASGTYVPAYNPNAAIASYLTSEANGTTADIFSTLAAAI